jgi:hypothetical protein
LNGASRLFGIPATQTGETPVQHKTAYQAAGGWWYCWNDAGGMWICRDALPGTGGMSNNRYADLQYATDITAVQ